MSIDSQKHFETNVRRWSLFFPKEAAALTTMECSSVSFCQSADGELNLRREKDGQASFFLHDEDSPKQEAKKWFFELPLKNVSILYVYGVGLGYDYEAAWEWLRADIGHTLIFFEDDLEVIHRLFETEKGTNILFDQQVILRYWGEDSSGDSLDSFLSNFTIFEYYMSALRSYEKYREADVSKFKGQVAFLSVLERASTSEYGNFGLAFFNNFFRNMLYLPQSYLGNSLFGKFSGVPAIICGAGPSLEKNIKTLEALKDRALIFAGGTALNALNAKGILPHFGVGIDPNVDHFTRLVMNQAYETPFFYRNRMLHDAFKLIHGDKLFITGTGGYHISGWFEKNLDIEGVNLEEGWNVLNFSLSIAHAMGCNPIIFVGVDLAYSQGRSYAPGLISHPILDKKIIFRTKQEHEELLVRGDIYGEPVHTLWKWIAEALWYSKYAATNQDVLLINSTEGGLGFPGVVNLPLEVVMDGYLTKRYDFVGMLHGEIQNSLLPPKATIQKVQDLMLELSDGLHRCWMSSHEIDNEFSTALKNAIEKNNFDECLANAKKIEIELYKEPAYTHFLKVFDDAYRRANGHEALRIRFDEGLVPDQEIQVKKLKLDLLRYYLLKQTALVNSTLIQDILKEYEDIQQEAEKWSEITKKKSRPQPPKFADDPETLPLTEAEKQTRSYPGGAIKLEQYYLKGMLHGPSTFYAENGTLLAKSGFVHGQQQGLAWTFYHTGAVHSLQRYRNGQWEGEQLYFYPDGSPKTVLNYRDGKLQGEVLLYYSEGRPKRSLQFVDGKRNGLERIWDEKGLLIIEAKYRDDHPIGIARKWHTNGRLAKEITYDDQSHRCLIRSWNPTGIAIEQEELFEDDYFDKVAKQTGLLTDNLEEVFKQINTVVPILSEKIYKNKSDETKEQSIVDLQKDFDALKQEMDRLRDLSKELKVESDLNTDNALEPLWKSPSTQREVEKQLEGMQKVMSEEIRNIEKGLSNVLKELFQKEDKRSEKDDKQE